MYNKLFQKILDSSVWLESSDTRIVWVTLMAAMDQDGFVPIATPTNLAARARVPLDACRNALSILESPEIETATPDDDGRRIERVPGGWIVLNAKKYQELATRDQQRESTRLRVQRYREKRKQGDAPNDQALPFGDCNGSVTQSEAATDVTAEKDKLPELTLLSPEAPTPKVRAEDFGNLWNRTRGELPKITEFSPDRKKKVVTRIKAGLSLERFQEAIENCRVKPFLRGENDTGWTATFDWLVKNDQNIDKAINNPYGLNRVNGNGGGRHAAVPTGKTDRNVGLCAELIAEDEHRSRTGENGFVQTVDPKQDGPATLLLDSGTVGHEGVSGGNGRPSGER